MSDTDNQENHMSDLLPVGTLVQVTPMPVRGQPPYRGIVRGYDTGRTKYEIGAEYLFGQFGKDGSWAFPSEVERVRICSDHRRACNHVDIREIWPGQRIIDRTVGGRGGPMGIHVTRLVLKRAYPARTGTGMPKQWRLDVTGDCYVTNGTLPVIGRY